MKDLHKKVLFRAADAIRMGTAPDPGLAELLVLAAEETETDLNFCKNLIQPATIKGRIEELSQDVELTKIGIPEEHQTTHAYIPLTEELAEAICKANSYAMQCDRVLGWVTSPDWALLVNHALRVLPVVPKL